MTTSNNRTKAKKPFPKPAHWSTVTKAIQARFGLTWEQSKKLYRQMEREEERRPSLRMVARYEPPRAIVRSESPPPPRRRRASPAPDPPAPAPARSRRKGKQPPAPAPPPARPRVEFKTPPPAPRGYPATSKATVTRSRFEEMLKDRGLPLSIARHPSGRAVARLWKTPEIQERVADAIADAFKNIVRPGRVTPKRKDEMKAALIMALGPEKAEGAYHQIFRSMYSKPK